jgi:hypothetical protein
MDSQILYRLMALDHLLSSRGVELYSTAEEFGVTPETILCDLELLRSVGCGIVCREVASEPRGFYAGERLFNVEHESVRLSAMITAGRFSAAADGDDLGMMATEVLEEEEDAD